MNAQPVSLLPDADMQAVPAAMFRAALRAREIARQTGTAVVVLRDGKLVELREANSAPVVKRRTR